MSSYTPAIRSLLRARKPHPCMTSAVADRRLLLVACKTTPGLADLSRSTTGGRDPDRLAARAPHTLYTDGNAVGATVYTGLEQHAWAHFSCHGQQQLDDPRQGGLWLHDGLLTIGELTTRRHLGEFAFLSACKTAVGGSLLPDESITLASALQFAGWRHVIGTLWTVGDQSAADITERMYQQLTRDGELRPDEAAPSLHHAVKSLRDHDVLRPTSWALFIHSGL